MARHYGWGPRSERVREAIPAGHWRTLAVLAALTKDGILASMSVPAPTDGDVFLAFIEQALVPKLEPGHIVVIDNPSALKVDGVRELIENCAATVVCLPPYSPGLSPIEMVWSEIKQLLRGVKAHAIEQLETALTHAIAAITPQDALAFFRRCRYLDTATVKTL